ncbi:MAG: CHASE2 domain-containing protein [Oscillospiraceae bacterium]
MNSKSKLHILLDMMPNILLVLLVVFITAVRFPKELEVMAEDGFYQKPGAIPDKIKIIAIDETTIKALGPYSEWDRTLFAELIEKLDSDPDARPKVIGIDIIFSGTNGSDGDIKLTEAVKKYGNVVLASKLETDSRVIRSESGGDYAVESYIKGEITAYESLNNVSESGFTNMILDDDGYVRRAYTYINSEGRTYKSFAYLIAEKIADEPDKLLTLPQTTEICYSGKPGDFETIPMSMVLDGTVPASYFADSTVLVGAHEEGMLDSYKVPIDHSAEMYGVECHANAIWAFAEQKQIKQALPWAEAIIAGAIAALFGIIMRKKKLSICMLSMAGIIIVYPLCALAFFYLSGVKASIIYIPIGVIIQFLVFLLLRYVELQKKRADEMQKMLFSMADSMAEAIEGRTPYNANHTKNVAKRCIEMLDYINLQHKEKKTDMYFSENDKKQLYLAAMLHDIGKMDVPLEIMDKPTKLGHLEAPLRSRLEIIMLRIKNDILTGNVPKESGEEQIAQIKEFLEKLDGYNCGRPLKEDEWAFVDKICESVYHSPDGEEIPFLTKDEADDLHIKAGTLSEKERLIMQSHVVYTDKILKHMHFGKDYCDVRAMAANHHELLNAKGYPNGIGADKLDVMTRILTIMDIYDSLIADDRPYKKAKPIKIAFNILDEEAEFGKIDKDLLAIAKEIWLTDDQ